MNAPACAARESIVASNWRVKKLRFATQQSVRAIHAHTHHSACIRRAATYRGAPIKFFLIGLRRSQRVLRRPIKRARALSVCVSLSLHPARSLCILKAAV